MPITAKLSKAFYERLGDAAANELVDWLNAIDADYRSQLRGLNELNFARFDAKLEQRFAQADAKLERRFAEYDLKLVRRYLQVDSRFAHFDLLLAELESRICWQMLVCSMVQTVALAVLMSIMLQGR